MDVHRQRPPSSALCAAAIEQRLPPFSVGAVATLTAPEMPVLYLTSERRRVALGGIRTCRPSMRSTDSMRRSVTIQEIATRIAQYEMAFPMQTQRAG